MEQPPKKRLNWLIISLASLLAGGGALIIASIATLIMFVYIPWSTYMIVDVKEPWRSLNVHTMTFHSAEDFQQAEEELRSHQTDPSPIPLYLLGNLYQEIERRPEAIEAYQAMLDHIQQSNWYDQQRYKHYVNDTYSELALLYYLEGNPDAASQALAKVPSPELAPRADVLLAIQNVLEDPARADYHFQLGVELQHVLNLPEARREFEEALQLSSDPHLKMEAQHYLKVRMPDKSKTIAPLAIYYIKAGDFHEHLENDFSRAATYYQKAIQLAPDFEWAYYHLGMVYRQMENDKKSIEYSQKALALNPDFYLPYLTLGEVAMDHENYQQAIIYYKKAFTLCADLLVTDSKSLNANIQNQLGYAYEQLNNMTAADSHYRKAIQLSTEGSEDHAYANEAITRLLENGPKMAIKQTTKT
jgi:tetratricopeptide (TPR) repeat protein